ncbi:MAG: excinuclease ABC subunit UvrC [bacterium]
MTLQIKIKSFPRKPGVYLFKDASGKVLYVGKAKRLRDRVRSYFSTGRDESATKAPADKRQQVEFLIKRARDIEYIVTDTEREALLLENTLIKRLHPRYNIDLRDDKTYVSIQLGMGHPSPGISLTRRPKKDKALYFGPYNSSAAAREAVDQITRFFRVRSCTDREFANRVRACLKHDIGRCTAPCVALVTREDYAKQVEEAILFLSGRSQELMRILEDRMAEASRDMRYEDAAGMRNAIAMLKGLSERQGVVSYKGGDHDAIGIARQAGDVAICVLQVRGGALIGTRTFNFADKFGDDSALLEEFLVQRYVERGDIPKKLFLQAAPEGLSAIGEILRERCGSAVKLSVPSRGEMLRLVALAATNAREVLISSGGGRADAVVLDRLGRMLKVRGPIDSIECVDISNTGGREAVGSLVAFAGSEPDKGGYRIYNIRTKETPDDYAMMFEVLSRRFNPEVPLRGKFTRRPLPDLLLVDGGKGQLAVAVRALSECGAKLPVAAIAKGEKKGHADQVFIPGRKNPLNLKRGSKELLLLQRIRDEAHRFGINAHRRRRGKAALGDN